MGSGDGPGSKGGSGGSGGSSSSSSWDETSSGGSSTSTGGSSSSSTGSGVGGAAGQEEEEEVQQEGLRQGEGEREWAWDWRPAGPLRPGMVPPPPCPGSGPARPSSPPPLHYVAPAAAVPAAAATPPTWRQVFAGLSVEGPGQGEAGAVEESGNCGGSSSRSVWVVPPTISPAWVRVAAPPPPRAETANRGGARGAHGNGSTLGEQEEVWALGRVAVRGMARALGDGGGDGGALEAACAPFWRLDRTQGCATVSGTDAPAVVAGAGSEAAAGGSGARTASVGAAARSSGAAAGGVGSGSGKAEGTAVAEAGEPQAALSAVLSALQLPELRLFLRDEHHVARLYLPPPPPPLGEVAPAGLAYVKAGAQMSAP